MDIDKELEDLAFLRSEQEKTNLYEAVDDAIIALDRQRYSGFPDDLISRSYLLKMLSGFTDREHGDEHFFLALDTCREIIEGAPSMEAWIPVSERLPEAYKYVEVTCRSKFGKPMVDKAYYSPKNGGIWTGKDSKIYIVTAWREMPMPYNGDKND